MTPPLTTREYAYLVIYGPGTHEQVTQILGLSPSEAWNVGELSPRNMPRKFMMWRLDSGLDDRQPLAMHLEELFHLLSSRGTEALRQLWVEYDLIVQCVGYFPRECHGMSFNREQIRTAAQLGLAFDFDFYYIDEDERDESV